MADTDIKLSVDLDITDADKTAQQLEREIKRIFQGRGMDQSASFTQLELQMKQNLQKAQALRQELERLSKEKIPTEEYKEVSRRLDKMNSQFDKLLIKQDEMQELGQTAGPAWEKLNIQMEQLGTLIREDAAELQQLVDTGKAFTLGSESAAYQKTMAALDGVNDKLKQEVIRHRELEDAEEQKARKTEESNSRVESSNNRATQSYRRAGRAAAHEAQQIGHAFTRRILPAVRAVRSAVSRMNHSLTKGLKPATANVKRLAMRFLMLSLGARSMFALLRKLRTAIVKAFGDLQKSGVSNVTNQVKELKASLATMKNALVAAFEPIISTIIPYLQRLADALTEIIDRVGQFVAALAGRSTYIKAVKQTGDAIEETGDQAEKASKSLAGFDKLNVIDTQSESKKFEEVSISEEVIDAAAEIKGKLDQIYKDFVDFKEKLKGVFAKIKIGDWIGAGADLGSLVDTLLTKLTEKIEKFIPTTEQAEKLGKAIAAFFKNAHLLDHIGDAVDILCSVIKAVFTAAFTAIQEFSPQEWYEIGQKIMDNIIKIFDTITEVLKEVPVKELAGFAQGLLSKSWDVAKSIATALKTLFVKAFSILWTTLTGTELSAGAEEALGEAANIALLAIGIRKVVKAIMGKSGTTGLIDAFSEKDKAFGRQQEPLENEITGMGNLKTGIKRVGKAITSNLIPILIGTTGLISLFSDWSEKTDEVTDSVVKLKGKVNDLANLGKNSYTLSGIQAIAGVISGIGTSASNSRTEIELLQGAIDNLNGGNKGSGTGNGGRTAIVPGTSGVTYDTGTGKVNSPATSQTVIDTADFSDKEVQEELEKLSQQDINNIAIQYGLDKNSDLFTIAAISLAKQMIDEANKRPPSGGSKPTLKVTKRKTPTAAERGAKKGIKVAFWDLTADELEFFTKTQYVNDGRTIKQIPGLTTQQIDTLLEVFGTVEAAKDAYTNMLSLNPNDYMVDDAHPISPDKAQLMEVAKRLGLTSVSAFSAGISTADADKLTALATAGGMTAGIVTFIRLLSTFFGGVPALARGGVIPAGKPFLAMLGDQKSGTNVEAPLDTIKQALSEVLANANMNATFQIVGDPHGMFKVIQKEANNYSKATGKLAF